MAKKYYEGKKDRMHESRGMKRYEENDSRGMKRYEKDMMDSKYYGMISEDHSAPANLPQEVVHKSYPKRDYFNAEYLDDTINRIDETRRDTIRNMERYESDVKI